ncbi:hypothetical protein F511_42817 [Dorcoceras hygrometricum]|uniref:Uncharacterized protein n=1 Tax=Dorcoceras hygrometricum TaxID=472368 RepID=A0A2Z7A897_9LAMI|nr:hypothetical protein F511_42817 [Dorcoceras hygrometricum]
MVVNHIGREKPREVWELPTPPTNLHLNTYHPGTTSYNKLNPYLSCAKITTEKDPEDSGKSLLNNKHNTQGSNRNSRLGAMLNQHRFLLPQLHKELKTGLGTRSQHEEMKFYLLLQKFTNWQQLLVPQLAHHSLQKLYRMKELLERSPTLPRSSKTTTGNDGNPPE